MTSRNSFNRVQGAAMGPAPTATAPDFNAIVGNAIPGFGGMSTGASGIVNQLMQGMPSAAPTQRANAYFGAQSGMPGSDFVRNRGFDLYGQEAEQYKQRGFDNFLKMIGAYSGTVMPTTGQSFDASQSAAELASRNRQADAQLGLDRERMNMSMGRTGDNSQLWSQKYKSPRWTF